MVTKTRTNKYVLENFIGDRFFRSLELIKQELLDAGAKNVTTRIESGKAVPAILQVAVGEGCCLIALSAGGRSLFGETFVGSTANNVARYAKYPVLFVA